MDERPPGKKEMDACMHATRLLDPTTPCLVSAASVVSLCFGRLPPPARRVRGGWATPSEIRDYQRSIQISELGCPSCLHTSWFARPPSGGLEAATDYKQVLACVRAWPYGVDKCNKKMQVVLQSHQHFRPRVAV